LKHKINEVSRSLVSKEEEVMSVKKRFKDEKAQLETANKRQSIQVEDLSNKLQDADTRFVAYKQSVEHSPLNVLRNELSQKQIEIVDQESKMA
jgi:centrosomal protein CEP120